MEEEEEIKTLKFKEYKGIKISVNRHYAKGWNVLEGAPTLAKAEGIIKKEIKRHPYANITKKDFIISKLSKTPEKEMDKYWIYMRKFKVW